jgi:hypothetical protein
MLKAFCALRTNAAPLSLEKPRWWWLNITITIIITTITTTTITIITIITTIIITTTTTITITTEEPAFARACCDARRPRRMAFAKEGPSQRRCFALSVAAPRMWRYVPSKTVFVADFHSVSADKVARL